MSSSGEMKMSLKLMTCSNQHTLLDLSVPMTYIFMLQMLEQLQLSVGPL